MSNNMRTLTPETSAVYGPILSRRFGLDTGINLSPSDHKLCTYDCLYCQYGFADTVNPVRKFPDLHEVIAELNKHAANFQIRHITISGNGEPTMHPQFAEFAMKLRNWRDTKAPAAKIALLTNGYRLKNESIRETLEFFDQPFVKLDAGRSETWNLLNRPVTHLQFDYMIRQMKKSANIMLQTMFVRGINDSPLEVECWMQKIKMIKPLAVHLYTLERFPAFASLQPVEASWLRSIAAQVTEKLGIQCEAY